MILALVGLPAVSLACVLLLVLLVREHRRRAADHRGDRSPVVAVAEGAAAVLGTAGRRATRPIRPIAAISTTASVIAIVTAAALLAPDGFLSFSNPRTTSPDEREAPRSPDPPGPIPVADQEGLGTAEVGLPTPVPSPTDSSTSSPPAAPDGTPAGEATPVPRPSGEPTPEPTPTFVPTPAPTPTAVPIPNPELPWPTAAPDCIVVVVVLDVEAEVCDDGIELD